MDFLKSNIIVGVSAALAVTVMAPVLLPVMATVGRPLAKSLLKGGLMLYEMSREAVASAGETVEDLVAELRVEEAMRAAAQEQAPAAAAAAPAPSQPATAEPARPSPNGGAGVAEGGAGKRAPQAGVATL